MDTHQQPNHHYMGPPPPPPPPSQLDNHYQWGPPPPQLPPPPLQGPTWYPNQFQYPHSPSPPPPHHHHQWSAPTHPDHRIPQPHYSSYPPPPPHFHTHPPHQQLPPHVANANSTTNTQFPLPPRPPVSYQPPYPQPGQDWSSSGFVHQEAHGNVEDWAAKAREWAAAGADNNDQHPQSHFRPSSRPEEQNRVLDQYPQFTDSRYLGVENQPLPASGFQQLPAQHIRPVTYPQENTSFSSGPYYVADGSLPYPVRDQSLEENPAAAYSNQSSLPTSSSVHQQEVPSSYSSITGKEQTADATEQSYTSLPISSGQGGTLHPPTSLAAVDRSVLMEQPPQTFGNQANHPTSNLTDQPLDFAPNFSTDHNPLMQPNYAGHSNSWAPRAAPGVVFPPIPSTIPAGAQHDPSAVPAPMSGHGTHTFGRFPASNFKPIGTSAGAPFDHTTGLPPHPMVAFPIDAYGVSGLYDRPKKASVPSWLREEIIKNKAAMPNSNHPRQETQPIEDYEADKSVTKYDHVNSKSLDSSMSTEEEEDEEDDVEIARTAAMNQEIKRILTEVLLQVTDEIFDEIAEKVLIEENAMREDAVETVPSGHKISSPPLAVPTQKTNSNISALVEEKEFKTEGVGQKSSSNSHGYLLGLANYASDDDEDDEGHGDGELQSSSMTNSKNHTLLQQSSAKGVSKDLHDAAENGSLKEKHEEPNRVQIDEKTDKSKTDWRDPQNGKASGHSQSLKIVAEEKVGEVITESGHKLDRNDGYRQNRSLEEKTELHQKSASVRGKTTSERQSNDTATENKNDQHESKDSSKKDSTKKIDINGTRTDESRRRKDGRPIGKEKIGSEKGSKDKIREQAVPESMRRSTHLDVRENVKDPKKIHSTRSKEDADRKRERVKDRGGSQSERPSDPNRNKRKHSSPVSSRGRKSDSDKHPNASTDEVSDGSKRMRSSRKRNSSPSPDRSKKRQVSRSPHSNRSHRRHSPYSSLETTRERRSRSRSPRRHRHRGAKK